MSAIRGKTENRGCATRLHAGRVALVIAGLCGVLTLPSTRAFSQTPTTTPEPDHQQHAPMPPMEAQAGKTEPAAKPGPMDMGSMQGGSAPSAARDPSAYSDGYEYTGTPGMEKAGQIAFGKLLFDQFEFTGNGKSGGIAWDTYAWYGGDKQKLLLRSEGNVVGGIADQTTSAEALWWRPFKPFWSTVLGMRQDFGPGSRTHLAFGVEGLAPYWFDLQATGYVDYNGSVSARLKGSYDLRLTNRLILTPEVESNLCSKANLRRALGAGMANIELQARLRYEISRTFAPYIGFDWDCALGDTAKLNRPGGEPISDARFVAGVRMWR